MSELAASSRATAGRPGIATWLCLAGVVLAWGGNWPFIKLAIAEIGPFAFTALRAIGAAAVTALILVATGRPLLPPRDERGPLGLIGLCQVALMLGLAALGLRYVSSGRAVVLGYTFPLWAIPIGAVLLGERIAGRKMLGAAVSIAGLLLFFEPGLVDWHDPTILLGNLLIVLGSVAWALGSCLYRRRAWRSDMWTQTLWQMLASAPVLALLAWFFEGGIPLGWSPTATAILVFNWLVPMAAGYWWWAKILAAIPASLAGQVLLLTPVIGWGLSALFFGEPVTPTAILSILLIVAGLMVTFAEPFRRAA